MELKVEMEMKVERGSESENEVGGCKWGGDGMKVENEYGGVGGVCENDRGVGLDDNRWKWKWK